MSSDRPGFILRIVLPIAVVALALGGTVLMIKLKPEVETRPPEVPLPLVRVQPVVLTEHQFIIESQGTVSPRTESQLIPEVSGRVTWVAPSFASGGFFETEEVLVKIDALDYRQALVTARSDLARAKLRLAQEEAEARVARREWSDLGGDEDASSLTLREPQLADAKASVEAAVAGVERAERNLSRTEVRAPYAGRVRRKNVDVGQFVTTGTPVATIYSVDAAEVRLPLPDDQLAFVDLPLTYRDGSQTGPRPKVTIVADFAGRRHTWQSRIVRTEGEIDPRTRMVHAVAEVKNPYAAGEDPSRPPLSAGMFVEAFIEGRDVSDVALLPRSSLRPDSTLWVIDEDNRLRYRKVTVVRATEDNILVSDGLKTGELVCVSPLDATTDGMRVRVVDDAPELSS